MAGTFDPVHQGHVALGLAAARECSLEEVWLMVNPQVLQQDSSKDGVASLDQRLEMARLAVSGGSVLSVYEGELASWPHIWETFDELARQEALEPVFVLGIDAFCRLDRWQEVEYVVQNATFAVARRAGVADGELADLRRRLGPLRSQLKVTEFGFEGAEAESSSRAKDSLRIGERPAGLDARVLEYILANQLYV